MAISMYTMPRVIATIDGRSPVSQINGSDRAAVTAAAPAPATVPPTHPPLIIQRASIRRIPFVAHSTASAAK